MKKGKGGRRFRCKPVREILFKLDSKKYSMQEFERMLTERIEIEGRIKQFKLDANAELNVIPSEIFKQLNN